MWNRCYVKTVYNFIAYMLNLGYNQDSKHVIIDLQYN